MTRSLIGYWFVLVEKIHYITFKIKKYKYFNLLLKEKVGNLNVSLATFGEKKIITLIFFPKCFPSSKK